MDQNLIELQNSYNEVAEEYVARIFHELEHKPLDREMLDRFAANVSDLGPVCDLGCGPVHVARYLHGRGVNVFGVDLSPRMVEQARQLNPGIAFQQGNMLSLEAENGAWGGIVAFYSLSTKKCVASSAQQDCFIRQSCIGMNFGGSFDEFWRRDGRIWSAGG
jgi:SAM-dependent methyltransferase